MTSVAMNMILIISCNNVGLHHAAALNRNNGIAGWLVCCRWCQVKTATPTMITLRAIKIDADSLLESVRVMSVSAGRIDRPVIPK